ncbi:MAG: transcriptional repressor [Deltaproteobacteria bacterium]|nr:transcriptional repressor [Deltaproteobacteria bacterium]
MYGSRFRLTRQRKVILEELSKMKSHPTAFEVYESVRTRIPDISLGTVYRNLGLLSSRGVIKKLEVSGHKTRFDANIEKHYHVRCVFCGRIDDVPLKGIIIDNDVISKETGYRILGDRVEFFGICPSCLERNGKHS